jgi:hypothetical protein
MSHTTDYKAVIAGRSTWLAEQAARGQAVTADQIVEGLLPNRPENAAFRDLVARTTAISRRDFDRAMTRVRIKDALGRVPHTAAELVTLLAEREGIHCRLDGVLSRAKPAAIRLGDDTELALTKERLQDRDVATYAHFKAGKGLRLSEFARHVRMTRDRLGLPYSDSQISDAVEQWYEDAKHDRRLHLFCHIEGPLAGPERDRVAADLLRLAATCFDTTGTSPEFIGAVLKKFVWQVKRKLRGLPVTHHLMPVLLGPQGIGKTTFVRRLIGPLEEAHAAVDFRMLTAEQQIEIWSTPILFIDEMGYASRTDADLIKNLITATTVSRRPMRTNSREVVPQLATFIGCSNKELSQLIRDPTGLRRFIGLLMRADADWSLINSLDWAAVWKLVDVDSEDPMLPHLETMRAQQEEARERSRVEVWLDQFDLGASSSLGVWDDGVIKAMDLYGIFREFEDSFFPGPNKTSLTEWGHEMKRLAERDGPEARFQRVRRKSGVIYRYRDWLGSARAKVVALMRAAK